MIDYESETIVIFKDIKPGSDLHYLAIPKVHLKNAKSLTVEHVPLREYRGQLGENAFVVTGTFVDCSSGDEGAVAGANFEQIARTS